MRRDATSAATPTEAGRYPSALEGAERQRVESRRKSAGVRPEAPWVGVGLSGGGIRSATFCLGFFQALARVGLVRRFDLLSTVSGGGYFGSFFSGLFTRGGIDSAARAESVLTGEEKPEILGNLRENGRYLAPNGSGDLLLAGAVLLRNWVAVQIVLLSFVLTLFAGLQALTFGSGLARFEAVGLLDSASVWWSPWWVPALLALLLLALPAGWAYWLVGKQGAIHPVFGVAAVLLAGGWLMRDGLPSWDGTPLRASLGLFAVLPGLLTLATWAALSWSTGRFDAGPAPDSARGPDGVPPGKDSERENEWRSRVQRNRVSRLLKWALLLTGGIGLVAVVDSLARTAYLRIAGGLPLISGAVGAALLALVAAAQKLAATLGEKGTGESAKVRLPMSLLAGAGALLLSLALSVLIDCLALGFVWGFGRPAEVPPALAALAAHPTGPGSAAAPPWEAFAGLLVLSWLFGRTMPFLNRSSQHALYAARLTRAYLGASNPERAPGCSISDVLRGDDPGTAEYWGRKVSERGAPLHLVNVTINETVSGRSQVEQQDRKGTAMALGPCGIHVGNGHHLMFDWADPERPRRVLEEGSWKVFRGPCPRLEGLSVGQWVGISGAAFSTGLGYRTSAGLSFLLGFANVRLGYWWRPDNPSSPQQSKLEALAFWLFPVQSYLTSELLARFPGTAAPRWYLSDGGHFENMGGYELIRRQLPRILIVDAEADPDYELEGLANLVRKARIDFGTEILFWDDQRLAREGIPGDFRPPLGTLDQLRRREREQDSRACAAIADVLYAEDSMPGRLLYVKTALCGGEPVDVREYHAKHSEFPHESTADQFFDEAQWESYRRLGQFVGSRLFGELVPGPQKPEQELLKSLVFDWNPRESGASRPEGEGA